MMRRRSSLTHLSLRAGVALWAFAGAACLASGCDGAPSGPEGPVGPVGAGPAARLTAEQGPIDGSIPRARRQMVQLMEEATEAANARVFVEFDVEDPRKDLPFYPYVMGGPEKNPLLFRDDGRGGDEKEGDGLFTAPMLVDKEQLSLRLEAEEKAPQPKEVPRFEGREIVSFGPARKLDRQILDGVMVEFFDFDFFVFDPVAAAKSVFITDPSVVRDFTRTYDPCTDSGAGDGPWSFGHLMKQMAAPAGIPASLFVEQWLEHWLSAQNENGFTAPARPLAQNLIDDWRAASGGGELDLAKAPFRLLAIVNRTDLGTVAGSIGGYGGPTLAFDGRGEMRLIFGLVIPPSYPFKNYNSFGGAVNDGGCLLEPFTTIFEYSILRDTCVEIKGWNAQWSALDAMSFGPAYNAALEAITDQLTAANAAPGRPNGSALAQLRTNDFTFGQFNPGPPVAFPWEMREFRIPGPMGFLEQVVVAETADLTHNNQAWTGNWIDDTEGQPPPFFFPAAYGASPPNALAAASPVPASSFFWGGAGSLDPAGEASDRDARHKFSLAACSGCHARETDTIFVHVDNRTPTLASPALLSAFLTDPVVTVADPAVPAFTRQFGDIARRQDRQQDIENASCSAGPFFDIDFIRELILKHEPLPDDPFKGFDQPPLKERVNVPLEAFTMSPVTQVH
jgi:hypothetical protein